MTNNSADTDKTRPKIEDAKIKLLELTWRVLTAYHEAGHAVVAMILGAKVDGIIIQDNERDGDQEARSQTLISDDKSTFFKNYELLLDSIVKAAGKIAQDKFANSRDLVFTEQFQNSGYLDEFYMEENFRSANLSDREKEAISHASRIFAEYILNEREVWIAVKRIVKKIGKNRMLGADEIKGIFQTYISESKIRFIRKKVLGAIRDGRC